jgi:hypothetical protein
VAARDGLELRGGVGDHGGDVDGLVGSDAAGVGAREQQEVGNESPHPTRRAQGGRRRLPLLAFEVLLE